MVEDKMNKEIISTEELKKDLQKIKGIVDELDGKIDKINEKLIALSTSNNIYYSEASINIHNNYVEDRIRIKKLHESFKKFIDDTMIIPMKYEELENKIIEEVKNIPINNLEV